MKNCFPYADVNLPDNPVVQMCYNESETTKKDSDIVASI